MILLGWDDVGSQMVSTEYKIHWKSIAGRTDTEKHLRLGFVLNLKGLSFRLDFILRSNLLPFLVLNRLRNQDPYSSIYRILGFSEYEFFDFFRRPQLFFGDSSLYKICCKMLKFKFYFKKVCSVRYPLSMFDVRNT